MKKKEENIFIITIKGNKREKNFDNSFICFVIFFSNSVAVIINS